MDVGQGDGICIMTEEGQTLFIDGGSSDVKALFQYRLETLMKYYGLRKIDLWLLTHGDEDHISGIREALEEGRAEIEKLPFRISMGTRPWKILRFSLKTGGFRL